MSEPQEPKAGDGRAGADEPRSPAARILLAIRWLAWGIAGALGFRALGKIESDTPASQSVSSDAQTGSASIPPLPATRRVPEVPAERPHKSREIHHPDGRIEHPDVRYERTDASFRAILIILLVAAGLAVAHQFFAIRFFGWQRRTQAEEKRSPYPLAAEPSTALPPEPRLEPLDRVEGVERPNVYLREASKERTLNSYGPTDEKGYVHVPIQRAIKAMAEQLPVRQQPGADSKHDDERAKDAGLMDWGESNSGRRLRRAP